MRTHRTLKNPHGIEIPDPAYIVDDLSDALAEQEFGSDLFTVYRAALDSVRTFVSAPLTGRCSSCGRRYDEMPYREQMLNGHMGHLELDPETGATVLIDEGR